jgi:hypothetical protein
METRLQAAGCETAPEAVQRTEAKIIPFPVMRHTKTETPPLSDRFQNEIDGFLREMGSIE